MVELADTPVSGTGAARLGGSSPPLGISLWYKDLILKTYAISGSKDDTDFCTFLADFGDYDTSSYIKEKLHKNHDIHRNYAKEQKISVKKYWIPFFKGRLLGGYYP